jgi:nitroimidazol reductase NimA-like FMN-containing flavoprotein (pyridoxamine 5'-phosphate oxidase superfamily)
MSTPDAATVREVFRHNHFCVIATASPTGDPWLSPVFFNYSPDYTLVWESAREALHSQYIRLNPRIAVFIKDTSTKAPGTDVYIDATAQEVPAERLAEALHTWATGPHGHSDRAVREVNEYGPSKPLRLYEARIQHLYVLTETVVDDYRVDTRVEMDVSALSEGATRRGQ